MAACGVHHHHTFDGIDQLMLLVGVRLDKPVFRVIGRAAANVPVALVDVREKFIQWFDHDDLFAIVDARSTRDGRFQGP
ncbi:hypothetical protein D3C78_1537810 [compost metagenome]